MEFSKETIKELDSICELAYEKAKAYAKNKCKKHKYEVYDTLLLTQYLAEIQEQLKITLEEKNIWKRNFNKLV